MTWRVRTKAGHRLLQQHGYVGIAVMADTVREVESEAYGWAIREMVRRLRAADPGLTVELSTGQYIDIDAAVSIALGLSPGGYEEGPG